MCSNLQHATWKINEYTMTNKLLITCAVCGTQEFIEKDILLQIVEHGYNKNHARTIAITRATEPIICKHCNTENSVFIMKCEDIGVYFKAFDQKISMLGTTLN